MWKLVLLTLAASATAAEREDFVTEPQDAVAAVGDTVELDCELVEADQGDICAWRIQGTHLDVDHFYNVYPPPKVRALFPEHERVCSIVIENIDWRHDGLWTCWPLGLDSHVSSRQANVTVLGWRPVTTTLSPEPTSTLPPEPTSSVPPSTTAPQTTVPPYTTTLAPPTSPSPAPTTTEAPPTTTPEPYTTTPPEPTTTEAPPTTTTLAPPTTHPGPGFQCPAKTGLFADPENPRYFYYCEDWVPIHLQCETGHWDDVNKRCS